MKLRKVLDCVEMKRKAQEKTFEETKHLSRDELVEYFNRQAETGSFARQWKRSRKTRSTARSARRR